MIRHYCSHCGELLHIVDSGMTSDIITKVVCDECGQQFEPTNTVNLRSVFKDSIFHNQELPDGINDRCQSCKRKAVLEWASHKFGDSNA